MRELKCAARGCIFTGVKHELLEHVVLSHEEDILTIVQGLDKRHVFELDQPEQTVSGATNHFVQAISPEYKPMKKDIHDAMAMYYCGRPLPFLCVCRIHYGEESWWGCQQGRCGPYGGHNCADCQRLDILFRGWPQGYVIGPKLSQWEMHDQQARHGDPSARVNGIFADLRTLMRDPDAPKINLRAGPGECVMRASSLNGTSSTTTCNGCENCKVYKFLGRQLYNQFR